MASEKSGVDLTAGDEKELRYLVERLLARACLASEGQDERLDTVLSGLRQYLRRQERDPASLRGFQERLDDALERLDDQVDDDRRETGRILSDLLSSLGDSDLPRDASSELKRLRRELGPRGLSRQQLLPWLETFAQVADQAMTRRGAGRERGLLGRLLSRGGDNGTATNGETAAEVPDHPPELDLGSRPGATITPGPADDQQRLRIARRVGELMDRIMQQVELPPDTHKRAILLKSRLSDQQDWALLRQSLDETADLVIAVVTHSQREFEGFLQRLDERLS